MGFQQVRRARGARLPTADVQERSLMWEARVEYTVGFGGRAVSENARVSKMSVTAGRD